MLLFSAALPLFLAVLLTRVAGALLTTVLQQYRFLYRDKMPVKMELVV